VKLCLLLEGELTAIFPRDLSGEGVFEIISDVLQSQDRKIVSAGYLPKSV
jgi:hypothetical protein